jgi:hypothetical protein
MKQFLLLTLALFISSLNIAQMHVRYNQAGYFPSKEKKIIIVSDVDLYGKTWQIIDLKGTVALHGELAQSAQGITAYTSKPYNFIVDFSELQVAGMYNFVVENELPIAIKITGKPYDSYTKDVLFAIRARRSGSNDAVVHTYSHGGDTVCKIYERVNGDNTNWVTRADNKSANMLGGWYDAGDYIKFTLTTAYTTYFLLKSFQNNPQLFTNVKDFSTTELNDLLDEAEFGLTYLMKTMPEPGIFIIQTGGSLDHEQNMRLPQNDLLNTKRECYSALSKPQMAMTVAALALGSKIFSQLGYSAKALEYKNKAIEIYTAAKLSTSANAWWEGGSEVYYSDMTENDNLELAAIELYNLTATDQYLEDAKGFGNLANQAYWVSWGDVNLISHSLLYSQYKSIATFLVGDLMYYNEMRNTTNNIWKAPHESTWGTLYSYFGVANGALMYQKMSSSTAYEPMALDVLNYTFGLNPWGLAFVASQNLPKSITSSYAIMYRLQPSIFPRGEIAEGPTTSAEHANNSSMFSPAHNPNLWQKEFNSPNFTFFEQPGDYVCMETTITGLADGLFLMATAASLFNEDSSLGINQNQPLNFTVKHEKNKVVYNLSADAKNSYTVFIYNSLGVLIDEAVYTNVMDFSKEIELHKGLYIIRVEAGKRSQTIKVLIE